MEGQQQITRRTLSPQKPRTFEALGNAIVDGILHGMLASVLMLAFYIVLGALSGYSLPLLLTALAMPDMAASPMQGALGHLAMGALYGVVWSTVVVLPVRRLLMGRMGMPEVNWRLAGLAFGAVAWGVAEIAIVSQAGVSLLPWFALLVAYLGYGGTLGVLQARQAL